MGIRHVGYSSPFCPQKLALTSPISSGHSVGIVRSKTGGTEFVVLMEKERKTDPVILLKLDILEGPCSSSSRTESALHGLCAN
jgi:hypothetical protein